jgi:hypothetical protein
MNCFSMVILFLMFRIAQHIAEIQIQTILRVPARQALRNLQLATHDLGQRTCNMQLMI